MFTINSKIGREVTKYERFNVKTHNGNGVIINTSAAVEALNNSVLYYIILYKIKMITLL